MNIISTRYYISLFLIITTLLSIQETSRALDTINTSGVFRDNGTTLISAGWTFELGFFSPENSSNRYVGIWYQNITVRTVVWVANRDNPLIDRSGMLKFGSGILVLVDGTNEVVWSTNTSRYVQNPVAQLLDSGNLVVKNANSDDNPENFIWQSFHYPTDTLLPGMKLGWNFATGLEVYLTSWNNRNDPASGEYTYHCDPTGYPQNVLKHRTSVLYRTGPWNGLGFSPENSSNRYVGIWYQNITVRTVVWVANRDNPLIDRSGMLKFGSGILVLVDGTNEVVWSTNTSRYVQNPVAQLLDSGNLVVKNANSDDNPENFIWQSFHYPTDTLLPGMKLGWNFATGLEVYLTSWNNRNDPASGEYTYHCDPTGYPQNVLKHRTSVLYRTGPWNGLGFSGNSYSLSRNILTFGVVMNENEVYYRFELVDNKIITRFTLSDSGVGQTLVWSDRQQSWVMYLSIPIDNCDVYNFCGQYGDCNVTNSPACGCLDRFEPKDPQGWGRADWSNGCIRRSPLNCRKDDVFLRYSGIKLPDTKHSWSDARVLTLGECRELCSRNCSCRAYASLYIDDSGCLFWTDELVDIREITRGQDIYIRMASSEQDGQVASDYPRDSGRKKREILIVTLSLVIGIPLLCVSLFLYARQRKKLDRQRRGTGRLRRNYNDENNEDLELPLFDFSQITKATDNFSVTNKLGQGRFGPVYKGLLEKGQEIAVKCLSRTSRQGVDEFKNEIICIAKLQHRNLVKLLGWCIHGEETMLVYEYMPNISLDLILFDPTKSILLDWPTRFNIINGIARGLMYLYQDSRLRVIHRDLKASNILLDSDMNPKISDFGLARTFGGNETGAGTERIVGTYGYMSPEYAVDGVFSVKSDVFSYGVIVLEIVTGKRNKGFCHKDHLLNLLGHAWVLYKEGRSLELVDSCLGNSCYLTQVVLSIHIGLLCVQERPEDRPNMSSVVQMLSNDGVLPEAKNPGFFTARDLVNTENSATPNAAPSTNTMTFSLLEAR